jgi:hypothetical protein
MEVVEKQAFGRVSIGWMLRGERKTIPELKSDEGKNACLCAGVN